MKDYNSTFNKNNNNSLQQAPEKSDIRSIFKIVISICVVCFVLFILFQIPGKITKPLESVTIKGNDIIDKTTIAKYLEISADQSWFDTDIYVLSKRLKRLSWVDTVVVRKNFWQGINVYITEQSPIAFLRVNEQTWFICEDGLILDLIQQKETWDLPVIVNDQLTGIIEGKRLSTEFLNDMLETIRLLNNNSALPLSSISEIVFTDPINIKLITIPYGIVIKLGFENFEQKLTRLSKAMPKLNEYVHNIDYIDLRHSDGVVFKKIH